MTTQHFLTSPLCTRADVLRVAFGRESPDFVDYSGSDVDSAIEDADQDVFDMYGPAKKSMFYIAAGQTEFEFRRDNYRTYDLRQVAVWNANDNRRTYLPSSGSYTVDLRTNKFTFTASQVAVWSTSYCQIDYVPYAWHLLAKNKAALNLLDGDAAVMQPGEGVVDNPRVSRIAKRIRRIEANLRPVMAEGSDENKNYDVRDRDKYPIFIEQDRFQTNPTA